MDTGAEGLRPLPSEVTFALPPVTDTNNNELKECVVSGDESYTWGSVVTADIQLAGEKAGSVPVQLIDSSNSTKYPVSNLGPSGPLSASLQSYPFARRPPSTASQVPVI